MKRKILLPCIILMFSMSTGCGRGETLAEQTVATVQADQTEPSIMQPKMDKILVECGDILSADPEKYIYSENYNDISMYVNNVLYTEDTVYNMPTYGEREIRFLNEVTGETVSIPFIVQDTVAPVVTGYLGSYQYYLQNPDGTPKDSFTLNAASVWADDFQIVYDDATECTLAFSNTNLDFADHLSISYISDFMPGTYENSIIITDLGGNTATVPIVIEIIDAPEPGENYTTCICSDRCDEGKISSDCPVCSSDPALCIGIEPELYTE